MFTTGSKFFLGATVVSLAATIAFGVFKAGDVGWTGTIGLLSATIALVFLTTINFLVRDCNVSSMDDAATTTSSAAQRSPGSSMWPAVAAIGGGLVVVGLVTRPVVFQAGLVILLAAVVEWMVQGWSERASSDRVYNATLRKRVLHPLEFPVLGALGLAVVIYSFSRIMLFISKANGPIVFAVIAALVLLGGFLFASRGSARRSATLGICVIAAIGLVSTGAVMAIDGEREIHEHETIESDNEVCTTNEEAEIDERGSQSIALKSSVSATVIFDGDKLHADVIGIEGAQQVITLQRSNPANIIFRNEDDEPARLTASLGTFETVVNGTPVKEQPLTCTTLVEEGGSQLLTLTIAKSSVASLSDFTLSIPGLPATPIKIVVP